MSKTTPLQATAPRKIWLQISDDADHHAEPFPREAEITWCEDSVTACQVGYVREDLAQPATMSTTEALRRIKALVVGDARPNWPVDMQCTATRGVIADICDAALAAAAPSPAAELDQSSDDAAGLAAPAGYWRGHNAAQAGAAKGRR